LRNNDNKFPDIPTMRKTAAFALALAAALGVAAPVAYAQTAPVAPAQIAPAQIRDQVPGYYRFAVGDIVVTALYDGYIDLKNELFKGAAPEDFKALLERMFVESEKGAQTAVNAFLIHNGEKLVLVDTGTAKAFGPTLGAILQNLQASGYDPAQVDAVLLTHLHPDHANGLIAPDGKPAFPNADVWAAKAEADFWLSAEVTAKAPEGMQPFFKMAQAAVAPYQTAGRFKTFAAGEALPINGVSAVAAAGHTPGHSGYLVKSKETSLLIWGDILHSHAAQFANPDISLEFDVDQPAAVATRKKLLAEAAAAKLWVAGAHLPFPGVGHVRAEGDGRYAWVPAEYSPLRNDR
jgi:glyoxylase-like metal-dependent hydrolase (beta-lactamase superfamily II)